MSVHLEKALDDAAEVIGALRKRGFIVLRVAAETFGGRPIVEIAASPLCEELRGTPLIDVTNDGRREKWISTSLGGCRVQWRPS